MKLLIKKIANVNIIYYFPVFVSITFGTTHKEYSGNSQAYTLSFSLCFSLNNCVSGCDDSKVNLPNTNLVIARQEYLTYFAKSLKTTVM